MQGTSWQKVSRSRLVIGILLMVVCSACGQPTMAWTLQKLPRDMAAAVTNTHPGSRFYTDTSWHSRMTHQFSMLNSDGSVIEMSRARAQRDDGMSRAARHAESDYPGWADVAFRFLHNFAVTHQHFISEDVSDASRAWGMVQPSTDRAWGNVYKIGRAHV